jgi:hypothetical protein
LPCDGQQRAHRVDDDRNLALHAGHGPLQLLEYVLVVVAAVEPAERVRECVDGFVRTGSREYMRGPLRRYGYYMRRGREPGDAQEEEGSCSGRERRSGSSGELGALDLHSTVPAFISWQLRASRTARQSLEAHGFWWGGWADFDFRSKEVWG